MNKYDELLLLGQNIARNILRGRKTMKTVKEAAEACGVSRQTVHYWILARKIKAQRLGSYYVITDAEVARVKALRDAGQLLPSLP